MGTRGVEDPRPQAHPRRREPRGAPLGVRAARIGMGVRPGGVSEFELGLTKRSWKGGAARKPRRLSTVVVHYDCERPHPRGRAHGPHVMPRHGPRSPSLAPACGRALVRTKASAQVAPVVRGRRAYRFGRAHDRGLRLLTRSFVAVSDTRGSRGFAGQAFRSASARMGSFR